MLPASRPKTGFITLHDECGPYYVSIKAITCISRSHPQSHYADQAPQAQGVIWFLGAAEQPQLTFETPEEILALIVEDATP